MASGGRANYRTLVDGIQRYRDFGGKRALIATVPVDLSQPEASLDEDAPFTLRCGPKSASERLAGLLSDGAALDSFLLSLPARVRSQRSRQDRKHNPSLTGS